MGLFFMCLISVRVGRHSAYIQGEVKKTIDSRALASKQRSVVRGAYLVVRLNVFYPGEERFWPRFLPAVG